MTHTSTEEKNINKNDIADTLHPLFIRNRNCIVNADLDGVLSGMILQKYLGWRVLGVSSCSGSPRDNLWVSISNDEILEAVFVDLPVIGVGYSCIDQHFLAIDDDHVATLRHDTKKANPNITRGRCLFPDNPINNYRAKYPFGTIHYILAGLEALEILNDGWQIPTIPTVDKFDAVDLVLRADRVAGNFAQYGPNCINWANWLMQKSGPVSQSLFNDIMTRTVYRVSRQSAVEAKLTKLNCARGDGECSGLVSAASLSELNIFLQWLSTVLNLPTLVIPNTLRSHGGLYGSRIRVTNFRDAKIIHNTILNDASLFSYAIVRNDEISITKIR